MLGTLERTGDGRCTLRFERRLRHPQSKVWRAIIEPGQMRAWFVQILDYDRFRLDLAPGAEIVFVPKAEHEGMGVGHGVVTRLDPPNLLEYTWDSETLRWELEADGDTACRLVFTNTFDDRDAAASMGAGWHAGLDLLESMLDGRRAPEPAWDRLRADYEHALR
ncbi:SRPBCC family protein [Actinomadura alba]|uniref:SRPBCC family protein n=1 Tax=Actinomadura alba TaxID=406431 RepID=UPI001C9D2113|nr:SRPBCC family protein [Actinomadura alba]